MRRTATVVLAITAAVCLAGTPALAAEHGGHAGHGHAASHAAKHHRHARPAKANVTLTGVLVSSDTATSTITMDVKGGTREFHGQKLTLNVDPKAVIRRNGNDASAADLMAGDHLSVKARRDASGGTLTAYRINAASDAAEPSPSSSPSS